MIVNLCKSGFAALAQIERICVRGLGPVVWRVTGRGALSLTQIKVVAARQSSPHAQIEWPGGRREGEEMMSQEGEGRREQGAVSRETEEG